MPFKIVQTYERGKKFLSCVPNAWEDKNMLFWPRKGSKKLQKDEYSQPADDWISSSCIVKRSHLSYEEAQAELSLMQQQSDTEDSGAVNVKRRHIAKNITNIDLDELARQCILDKENISPMQEEIGKSSVIPPEELNQTIITNTGTSIVIEDENQEQGQESTLFWLNPTEKTNFEVTVLQRLENIEIGHNNILRKLAELGAQIEGFLRQAQQQRLNSAVGFEAIDNLEALQHFDELLKNKESADVFKQKLSAVCGSGKGRGTNNCFSLVDVIFTRRFLTECSWAGGSRNESTKICFKAYNRVISFFFDIIYNSDKSFTVLECQNFFKNILKNSSRRNSAKMQRTSATKARGKGKGKGKKSQVKPAQNNDGDDGTQSICPQTTPSNKNPSDIADYIVGTDI